MTKSFAPDKIGYIPKKYLAGGQKLAEQARLRWINRKHKPVENFLASWLSTFRSWLRPPSR